MGMRGTGWHWASAGERMAYYDVLLAFYLAPFGFAWRAGGRMNRVMVIGPSSQVTTHVYAVRVPYSHRIRLILFTILHSTSGHLLPY